ncbi:hypothetical protein JTB14_012902 [Gonioctena quinquepunctata]|nr:hypothetical protein JTB14_012902 [Gonioctena quinquepunctata]
MEDNTLDIDVTKKDDDPPYLVAFLAEMIGTAILLFLGCMGCIFNYEMGPLLSAFSFGLGVMMPIEIYNHITPCHVNPGVSLSFFLLGELKWQFFLIYIAAQYLGAFLGYGLLKVIIS